MSIKLTTSKKELYNRVNSYFKKDENSWLNLNDFIKDNCPQEYVVNKGWLIGVANYLQNTARYTYTIQPNNEFYEIKPNPSYKWDKQNLLSNRLKLIGWTAFISAIIPTITALYLHHTDSQQQSKKELQQDTIIYNLKCEVEKIKNDLKNSRITQPRTDSTNN